MYVLVLGLDVLGNPFGLISGLAGGAKDFFYEPYQVRQCDSLSRYPEYQGFCDRNLRYVNYLITVYRSESVSC